MKLNKKGFMMAEVIVVSAIIIIFLGTIYVSYNKILSIYKTRITYYDNTVLYELGYYRDTLIEDDEISDALNDVKTNGVKVIADKTNEKIFLIYNESKKLNGNELDNKNVNQTFKDYIKYLSTAKDLKTNYVMVGERCNSKNGEVNQNDCQYSYLEIYNPTDISVSTQNSDKYTVTYHGNNADYDGGWPTWVQEVTYGEKFRTPENWYSRNGYNFNGWNEKADGTGAAWTQNSEGVYESGKYLIWDYTKNIDLYAQWCMPKALCCGGEGEGKYANMCNKGETCATLYKNSYQCMS